MAKTFYISESNPIPFTKLVDIDPRYNTVRPSIARTPKTVNGCYFQKWQGNDATKIQFLSDWECEIRVFRNNGVEVATIVPIEVVTNIVNQTFHVYEAEFDFSDYGKGLFYAEISYTDDEDVEVIYQSEIWQTAEKWPDTMLWEYKNSYNARSVVYETGIEFNFRVESQVREYSPDFDSELYVDQPHNVTQLSAVTFKKYKLVTQYLPDWALTILTQLLNVDEKKGDGEYYEKNDGAKFEMNRVDGFEYGYASIDIVPITNFFLNRLIVGDMADGEYVIYPKRLQWIDNAVNRTIIGKFRVNTCLRRIDIINKGATEFTIKVGTTNGGNELGEKLVLASDPVAVLVCLTPFDSDTTVYITGIDDATLNLFVLYDQDDEVGININGGTGGGFRWPKGYCGYWEETEDGDLEAIWDLASGLGKSGTKFENCAIRDGRNGTQNELGGYDVAIDNLTDVGLHLGEQVGANTKAIAKANLPAEGVLLFENVANNTPNDKPNNTQSAAITSNYGGLGYEIHRGGGVANIGLSSPLGSGTAFDVRPKSFKKLPFKAITD